MKRLRVAAAYEVVAGMIGLGFAVRLATVPNGSGITFNIFAVGLALGSVAAGALTWVGVRSARQISLGFQLLQIPRLTSSAFMFGLLVGVEGTVRFQGPLLSLFTTAGVSIIALRPSESPSTVVGVNLVAAVVAWLLGSARTTPGLQSDAADDRISVQPRRDALDDAAG